MKKFFLRLVIVIVALTVLMLAGNIRTDTIENNTGFVALEQKCLQKCIQEQSFTQDSNAASGNFAAHFKEKG